MVSLRDIFPKKKPVLATLPIQRYDPSIAEDVATYAACGVDGIIFQCHPICHDAISDVLRHHPGVREMPLGVEFSPAELSRALSFVDYCKLQFLKVPYHDDSAPKHCTPDVEEYIYGYLREQYPRPFVLREIALEQMIADQVGPCTRALAARSDAIALSGHDVSPVHLSYMRQNAGARPIFITASAAAHDIGRYVEAADGLLLDGGVGMRDGRVNEPFVRSIMEVVEPLRACKCRGAANSA